MGDGAPYAWLTREVWKRAYVSAVRLAKSRGHPEHEAKDLAQKAILQALDPEGRPWAPLGERNFVSHVCGLVYSAHGNHIQSYRVRKASAPLTEEILEGHQARVDRRSPERALEESRAHALAAARWDMLRGRVEKDALVCLLLEAGDDGSGERSTDRALDHGHTLDEIEAARKRLKRHIEAVMKRLPDPDAGEDER